MSDWQPMETAPRNGQRVWAWFPNLTSKRAGTYAVHWSNNVYEEEENWTLDDGGKRVSHLWSAVSLDATARSTDAHPMTPPPDAPALADVVAAPSTMDLVQQQENEALADLLELGRAALDEACVSGRNERDASDAFRDALRSCSDDLLWRLFNRARAAQGARDAE